MQEIFLDLWKSAGRYDVRLGSETTFVATIARRRLVDRRRQHASRPETASMIEAASAMSTGVPPEMGAEAALAARALDQLRPEQRQVLILTACHGLSHTTNSRSTAASSMSTQRAGTSSSRSARRYP